MIFFLSVRVHALGYGNEIHIGMPVHLLEGIVNFFSQVHDYLEMLIKLLHWSTSCLLMPCNSEYPLFIPRPTFCNIGETSWSDKSSSNFGVASMESVRKPRLDSTCSFNCASASPHSIEKHKDLQKGISILKKSVACVTAYCYNSLRLDVPTEASTFEALARLLTILSSSKEMRYVCSMKAAPSRYLTHFL